MLGFEWGNYPFGAGVVSSLVATLILFFLAKWKNWIVVGTKKAGRTWGLARRLDAFGMTEFFASRADYAKYRPSGSLGDYLATAKHRIDVAGYWMGHGHEAEAIAQSIVARLENTPGMSARIALINPDGPMLGPVAAYLNLEAGEVENRLRASLRSLSDAKAGASASVRTRLSVLVYDDLPLASVILLDYGTPSARAQLDFKLYKRPRAESFSFELRAPSAFYDRCASAWIQVVDHATPYNRA